MRLYEEPTNFRVATETIEWGSNPEDDTVRGVILWVKHCTGILNSTKALPLRNNERIDLEDILCVIQDLDTRVFSSLQANLQHVSSDNFRPDLLSKLEQGRKQLHQAFREAPLSINLDSAPNKGIPSLSPLELRIRPLCKQASSETSLRDAIKQLHKDHLQIYSDDPIGDTPDHGTPKLVFLAKLDLPETGTVYFLNCTAEVCPPGMEKLQDVYRKLRADRFTDLERTWIQDAHRELVAEVAKGVNDRPRLDARHSARMKTLIRLIGQVKIFQHSYASCRTQGSALRTIDMRDRDRCHSCRVSYRFKMPYEKVLSESDEPDRFYNPLSCAEPLVMALQHRYLRGESRS